jgi:hypothetical protein
MTDAHLSDERMAEYLRGAADGASERELEAHVAGCTRCAERLAVEARVDVAAHELAEKAAPVRAPKARARRPTFAVGSGLALALAAAAVLAFQLHTTPAPRAEIARDVLPVASSTASATASTAPAQESDMPITLPSSSAALASRALLALSVLAPVGACSSPDAGPSTAITVPSSAVTPLPAHWFPVGRDKASSLVGVDGSTLHAGQASLIVTRSTGEAGAPDFGGAGRDLDAAPYRGKRVRLTGFARTSDVRGKAGFWFRVDGERPAEAFANMDAHPICGTTDWTSYTLVLDVPPSARKVVFGNYLAGDGTMWTDEPKLDVVDGSVPLSPTPAGVAVGAHTSGLSSKWFIAGSAPDRYTLATSTRVHHGGTSSIVLASKANATADVFSTAMQDLPAAPHVGQRVRLSAYVKTEGVTSWAGLWVRVDGSEKAPLAFDNMAERPITGTTEWTRYSIVLPVAAGAKNIALGVLENGPGQLWMDDVVLEDLPPGAADAGASPTGPVRF